jgi:hypothetical protein
VRLRTGMNGHLAKSIDPDQIYRNLIDTIEKEAKGAAKDE